MQGIRGIPLTDAANVFSLNEGRNLDRNMIRVKSLREGASSNRDSVKTGHQSKLLKK